MSKTRRKKTTRKKKSGSGDSLVPHQRKKEILGLVLIVLALLLGLAIVTYSPQDAAVARAFSVEAALDPGDNRARNALGLVGAALARLLVPEFIGYTVFLFPLLGFAWGYVLFRQRTPLFLPIVSILLGVGAFIVAGLFGWFGLTLDADLSLWAGSWGMGTAGWMSHVFGTVGSFILLVSVLVITALLLIDRDIQRSLDRVEELVASVRDRIVAWWTGVQARKEERSKERARVREERRKAREEAEKARAELKEHERQRAQEQIAAKRKEPKRSEQAPVRSAESAPAETAPVASSAARSGTSASSPASAALTRLNDRFKGSGDAAPAEPSAPPQPAPSAEPSPGLSLGNDEDQPNLELKVRERVEEEKADPVDRITDDPDEDLPFDMPPLALLDEADENEAKIDFNELEENKQVLLDKLETYKIEITDINAVVGPTVTLYELTPAPGVKISRITSLEDDLAMAMAARGIRMIAPIPGKSAIGVEVANRHRELVRIRDVIGTAKFRDANMELPLVIGKTIEGEVFLQDLAKMPHVLIAGATGSGKSVGLNTFIAGLLYACPPSHLKFVMIDPKKIELQQYNYIADHYIAMPEDADDPIITDFAQALGVLKSCEKEMEQRYDLLSKASVRSIKDYNKKLHAGKLDESDGHRHLPYIVVVVDELADLMMTAGKDIEGPIARLAQMARAVGIHLILATQRPSVDVITGLIKANFPARIAFQVASKIDSRTILDQNGAEQLVGNGDLLFMLGSRIMRLQGPYVSVEEVDNLTEFIASQPGHGPYYLPPLETESDGLESVLAASDRDELFEEAARVIVRNQQGSVSLLQRKLAVGYSRAARMVDQLEDAGIVGPFEGSKARQVLVESEIALEELFKADKDDA